MRIIKFRGKRCDDGEWVYGYYARLRNEFKEWHCIMTEEDASENYIKDCNGYNMLYTPINQNTLGQFTGLYDKNGEEIYEGDIVRYYETRSVCINPDCEPYNFIYNDVLIEKLGVINFVDGMFSVEDESNPLCWQGFNDLEELRELLSADEENEYTDVDGNTIDETKLGIEVIGNIHDNPKLLEGGEQ